MNVAAAFLQESKALLKVKKVTGYGDFCF